MSEFNELSELITFLEEHNAWRRGADIEMKSPKQIGLALEKVIEILKSLQEKPHNEPT